VNYQSRSATTLSPITGNFYFSGNSIWNPDMNSSSEYYPVGVPQLAQLYSRYQVAGSSLEVTVQSMSVDPLLGNARFLIYAHPYTDANFALSVDQFSGQPLSGNVMTVCTADGGKSTVKARASFRTSTVLCRPESQIFCGQDTSGYVTSVIYQPNSQWFWEIPFTNNFPTGAAIPELNFTFRVTYDVNFYSPNQLTDVIHSTIGAIPPPPDPDPCLCDIPPSPLLQRQKAVESKEPEEGGSTSG